MVSCTVINLKVQAAIIEARSLEDIRQFLNIVDHAAIAIFATGFLGSRGEENSVRPLKDGAALADHLAVRSP